MGRSGIATAHLESPQPQAGEQSLLVVTHVDIECHGGKPYLLVESHEVSLPPGTQLGATVVHLVEVPQK